MTETRVEDATILRGRLADDGGKAPRRARAGRTCEHRGCETVLSVYNPGGHCWSHTAATPYLLRVGRMRPSPR